jgi:hypothetical protein
MKKLLQFSHFKFLIIKTDWLLAIAFTIMTVFTGCKRDFPPPCHEGDSFTGKGRGIIVHKGGSIQAAVDAAAPGETIFIEAGTYNEAIVVNKSGIHLIGSSCFGSEKVIIQNPVMRTMELPCRMMGMGLS